jgi:hypothetical protein
VVGDPSRFGQAAGAAGRRPGRHDRHGRVLDYTGRADGDRKLCSLYLSLLNRMGVKAERFGDATTPLAGL